MRKRILVIDDEPAIQRLMKSRLESQGYEVMTAGSGEESLRRANESAPDLILLDILMPQMDGYAVCRKLKESAVTQHIPVLMFTADERQGIEFEARTAGAEAVIYKPLLADVLATMRRIFEGRKEEEAEEP